MTQVGIDDLLAAVVSALEDKKAQDILQMDVQGRCAYADRFVIASGRTPRQLAALVEAVSQVAHAYGLSAKVEGRDAMQWLLIDLGDLIVHLFLPDVRETFQLERLWSRPDAGSV